MQGSFPSGFMEQLNEERRLRRGLGMGPSRSLPGSGFSSAAGGSAAAVPSTKSGDNRFPLPFRALFLPAAEDRDAKMPMDRKKPKGQIQRTCPFGYKIRGKMMSKIQETLAAELPQP